MNYQEFAILQKAVELYRIKLHEESLKAIEKQNQVGAIYWKVFRKYSITGFGETSPIEQVSEDDLLKQILMHGVSKKDLEIHLKKAAGLWEEWEESQDKHRKRST